VSRIVTIKPMPEPPPVTRATLPLTSKTLLSSKLLFDILIDFVMSIVPRERRRGERRYLSSRYDDLFTEVASDVSVTILPSNWWGFFGDRGLAHDLSFENTSTECAYLILIYIRITPSTNKGIGKGLVLNIL
jgi:hypothetical protein